MCSKHFTLNNNYRFFISLFFFINIKKEKSIEKKKIWIKSICFDKQEKKYWKILVSLPRFEQGASASYSSVY